MALHMLSLCLVACHLVASVQALPLPKEEDLPSVFDLGHYLSAVMGKPETIGSASQTLPIFWTYDMHDSLNGSASHSREQVYEMVGYIAVFLISTCLLLWAVRLIRFVWTYRQRFVQAQPRHISWDPAIVDRKGGLKGEEFPHPRKGQ